MMKEVDSLSCEVELAIKTRDDIEPLSKAVKFPIRLACTLRITEDAKSIGTITERGLLGLSE